MVGPNFRVGKKIGCGNFGELRLGELQLQFCFIIIDFGMDRYKSAGSSRSSASNKRELGSNMRRLLA